MTDAAPPPKRPRLGWVDSARGVALWAMVGFHLTWDLAYFGWIDHAIPVSAGFHWLGHAIAASFLLLVGVSLVLAEAARGPLLKSRAFWRRWARIVVAAGAISAASYWLFPETPIFFGILHCIALASLIAAPLVAAPLWVPLAAGVFALAAPRLFAASMFDAPAFWWTGLGAFEPSSNDFRPLLPWLAFVLFGVALGQALVRRGPASGADRRDPLTRALAFCGRHSLAFYLIHQPLLFGLFSLLAMAVVSPGQEQAFVAQCTAQCVADTSEADLCQRTCACVVDRAKAAAYWLPMTRSALAPEQKLRAHDDIIACFGDSQAR